MANRSAIRRKKRKAEAFLWAIPIIAGLLGLVIGYAVVSARADKFQHVTTLLSANDGRVGIRDNRDLALEYIQAQLFTNSPADNVDVDLNSRLGAALDITVTAPSEEQAASVAEELAAIAIDGRGEASLERIREGIRANEAAISEVSAEIAQLESDIEGLSEDDTIGRSRIERDRGFLADTRSGLERQILLAVTQIDSATPPISLSSSRALGVAREPWQIASLVGAASAMLALLLLAAATTKRD